MEAVLLVVLVVLGIVMEVVLIVLGIVMEVVASCNNECIVYSDSE